MRFAAKLALCLLLAAPSFALADEVQLRGGSKIEGKATREGDTVVIRVESGEIRVPAAEVEQIQKAEWSEDVVARKRAALSPRDVRGRIELAEFCRERDLRVTERALLQEVLELEPEHARARRLLGFERDERGVWVDRSRQLQAQRAAEETAWLERRREEARQAEREHAKELARARYEAEIAREEALRARQEAARARERSTSTTPIYPYYAYPVFVDRPHEHYHRPPPRVSSAPKRCPGDPDCTPQPRSVIHGTRHPRDSTWSLPGTRDPRESLR